MFSLPCCFIFPFFLQATKKKNDNFLFMPQQVKRYALKIEFNFRAWKAMKGSFTVLFNQGRSETHINCERDNFSPF